MKNLLIAVSILILSVPAYSVQWHDVLPADVSSIQIMAAQNAVNQPEGVYIGLKSPIPGAGGSYCNNNTAIVITDTKLADRAYAGILYALSTGKTIRLFLDGSGTCAYNLPVATSFVLTP